MAKTLVSEYFLKAFVSMERTDFLELLLPSFYECLESPMICLSTVYHSDYNCFYKYDNLIIMYDISLLTRDRRAAVN